MSLSFWIFLGVSIISLVPPIWDHGDTWRELREEDFKAEPKRAKLKLKLLLLWGIPLLFLIATAISGFESVNSDRQIDALSTSVQTFSNKLVAANAAVAGLQERTKFRQITTKQAEDFKKLTVFIAKNVPIRISTGKPCGDSESYAFQVRKMFDEAGFKRTDDTQPLGYTVFPDRVTLWPLGITNELSDMMIIFNGTEITNNEPRNFKTLGVLRTGQAPGYFRILPEPASSKNVFLNVAGILADMGINVRFSRADGWVKPGEFEIYIPCDR